MESCSEDEARPPATRVIPTPRRPSATTSRENSASLLSSLRARRERERNREDGAVRTVTPDSEGTRRPASEYEVSSQPSTLDINSGGEKSSSRRQGLVFEDTFETGDAVLRSMPPIRRQSNSSGQDLGGDAQAGKTPLVRPRNRTIDGQRHPSAPVSMRRQRVGSTNALGNAREIERIEKVSKDDLVLGAVAGGGHHMPQAPLAFRSAQAQRADSVRKKPPVSQKLVKRSNERSRSASPVPVSMSTDTLPLPIPAENPNRVLKLMENMNGRMRGEIEYQTSGHGSWATGICYINDRGMLMNEGAEAGSFHQTIVPDLRGCRLRPYTDDNDLDILDVSVANGMRLRVRPLEPAHYTYWLSALLSWQQNLSGLQANTIARPESRSLHRRPSFNTDKNFNIIKIGKVQLWDNTTTPPQAPVSKKSAHAQVRRSQRSWKKVSCILQDNGEFKLMTEEIDTTLLATIQLSQLSRSAIQQLDKTVLNQEFTIAIFPQYTASATSLSILQPIYISLETRVLFEVWFVLLRAFTVPELYGSEVSADDGLGDLTAPDTSPFDDMFRIDKTLNIRVVEAKIKPTLSASTLPTGSKKQESSAQEKDKKKAELDPSVGDYFAEVVLDGEVRARTTTKNCTLKPFWREECEFGDLPALLPEVSIVLKKMSATKQSTSAANSKSSLVSLSEPISEILCGLVQIRMDQLERGKDVENWWPVLNEKKESIGEMLVRIRHDELVVLLQKDYQPLSDLLHKFNTGLTVQMSQVVPSKLRFLAETLLDIFQVSGQSAQWLVALVEDEVDGIGKETPVQRLRFSRRTESNESHGNTSEREVTVRDMNRSLTGEANLLFRGNSLLTQALDCHMRRVGSDYLSDVLGPKVREINSTLPDAEVDPSRLGPDEDIKKNWVTLNQVTTETWHCILSSATRCPSELRLVLKYIRAVAEDRYGDFLRTVPYTSVSGFLFLRFFCPALLNPKLFGLLRDHPHPKAQRTLTLIAKSLQVLANLGSFGQKEQWMDPMNGFLIRNRQGVKNFIDNVCDIPTERARVPPPPSYSTPLAILKRLPMSSKEGWLSLPYLIDDARTFAALVRFWLESTTPADGEKDKLAAVTGDLKKFHEICLALQKRTDECLRKAEEAGSTRDAEQGEAAWGEILKQLEEIKAMDQRSFTEAELQPSRSATSIPSFASEKYEANEKAPTRAQSSGQARMEPRVEGRMRERIEAAGERWNSSQEAQARAIPGSSGSGEPSEGGSLKEGKEKKERGSIWASTFGKESAREKMPRYALGDVFSTQAALVGPGLVAGQAMGSSPNEIGLGIPRMQSRDGVRKEKKGFLAGLRGKYSLERSGDKGKDPEKGGYRDGVWREYLGGVDEGERERMRELRERGVLADVVAEQGERVQKRVRARKRRD